MKIKISLIILLLAISTGLLTTCIPDNGGGGVDNMNYAAKARQIVDDIYIYDGTQEDYNKLFNFAQHFETILDILGIQVVEDAAQITPDGPLSLTKAQRDFLVDTILMERLSAFTNTDISSGQTYYSLADIPEFLTNSNWQIERTPGAGDITPEELQGVMDYYISLYENNTTIGREYFAGYLIGTIAKNNPDVGTMVDQYSQDKLQMFLFVIDALTLPADSPLAAAAQSITTVAAKSISAAAASSKSYWGAGAKKLNIQPVNTKQKVIDIVGDTVKEYSYKFSLDGPTFIECGDWTYTASVSRTCRWTAGIIDPGDCSGEPEPVGGIVVQFTAKLQEHEFLASLTPKTSADGTRSQDAYCNKKRCPKYTVIDSKNVIGAVDADFSGTDPVTNFTIFPATAVLKVTEKIDNIKCYN
jgi:hypothetical protein